MYIYLFISLLWIYGDFFKLWTVRNTSQWVPLYNKWSDSPTWDFLQVAFDTINYTQDPWKFITVGLAPKLHCLSPVPPVLKGFNNTFFVSIKQLRFSPFPAEAISGSIVGDPTCRPFSFSNIFTFSAVSGVRPNPGQITGSQSSTLPAGRLPGAPCWGGFWRAARQLDRRPWSPGGISCGRHRGEDSEGAMSLPSLD